MAEYEKSWEGIGKLTTNYPCSLQKNCLELSDFISCIMKQKISQQMCSNYTLYAAVQTDFYLRQNELTAFPEVDNK